jgi:hypothetical protein
MNGTMSRKPGFRGPAPGSAGTAPLLVLLHDPRRQGHPQQEQRDDDDNDDFMVILAAASPLSGLTEP